MQLHPQKIRFSVYVEHLIQVADHLKLAVPGDPWPAAQRLAVASHGVRAVASCPALVDYACLAVIMRRDRTVPMLISTDVVERVPAWVPTDLPASVPPVLQEGWVIEPRDPAQGERLFGDTVTLAGYYQQATRSFMLIGVEWVGRYRVVPWRPRWGTSAWGIAYEESALIDGPREQYEWGQAAVRFLIGLVLLLRDPHVVSSFISGLRTQTPCHHAPGA
jgi:hypothetical protein